MKNIVWTPIEGMEASGPWCDGTAVIDGESYICDVITMSDLGPTANFLPLGYNHVLVVCDPDDPQYHYGKNGADNTLLLVVNDDWNPEPFPGYIDILSRHIR